MKLSRLGEFGLIGRIRRMGTSSRGVRIGIGDDCAWVDHSAGSSLITADVLIENIHFNLKWTSLFDLGYKSLAVNLSDIAAMGGVPAYAMLSLGIPAKFDSRQIDEFFRGFNSLARKTQVALIGGDTNISPTLIISVCLIGAPPEQPVQRSGAKVGDDIYVTGTLGDSALGLELLRKKSRGTQSATMLRLLARHHRPTPRLAAGALLAQQKCATAMIDISDGLLQDLGHICKASDTGAAVSNEKLPLSTAYRALAGKNGTSLALSGGEDYELLFCARRHQRQRLETLARQAQVKITRIGSCVTTKQGITVIDGAGKPLPVKLKGHDHFKKQ
ncbi:MAG: thiamine-phosphate kinase [Deltaproteobacteria bacterium]|nr:thiamine-phosphate kinase [Deltaproteobacteria bacterium]